MSLRKLTLHPPVVNEDALGFFRFGDVDQWKILTNDAGEWHVLNHTDFNTLLKGKLTDEHPEYLSLQRKGFIRSDLDLEDLSDKLRKKKQWLGQGPHLAVVITTLRCNQSCRYCHASRTDMHRVDTDMSLDIVKKVVDLSLIHISEPTRPY